MSKERDEFVALIAKEIPEMAVHHVAEFAGGIMRQGAVIGRAALRFCNGELQTDQYERITAKCRDKLAALTAEFGALEYMNGKMPEFKFILGGDPRGYCLKVILPSKRNNTWGGEDCGWGVPGS